MADLLVCAKQVYDLENVLSQEWRVSEDGQSIPIQSAGRIMNPCDANALELALRLRDQLGEDRVSVTVLTAGDERCRKMLSGARAVGAARCVRIPAPEGPAYDAQSAARTLCAAIRALGPFDLLLFGASAGEYDMGQTALLAAELLGLPVLQEALRLEGMEAGGFAVHHLTDGGTARAEARAPAVVTVGTPQDVCLRSPTLKAVLAAAKVPEELLECGAAQARHPCKAQNWLRIPDSGRACRHLDPGQPEEAAALLRTLLKEGGAS